MKKQDNILPNYKTLIIVSTVILFALISVFGLSLLTGNQDQTNVGNSLASATEPADINSDNKVDVFDLSILLSKWGTNNTSSDLNKDGTTNVFDLSILLSKWGSVTSNPPATTGVYGPAYNLDALQNIIIGSNLDRKASHRFRSPKDATVTSVRWWSKNYPGYGAGDGGIISVSLQSDSSGIPSGTVLGTAVLVPGGINNTYPLVTFTHPISVAEGELYHIVYENVASDPVNNYTSVNNTMCFDSNNPYQPKWPDNSFDALAKDGTGSWRRFYNSTPLIDITFSDGSHYGQGFNDYRYGQNISGNIMLREKYTVSESDRNVTGLALRIAKTSGTGNLLARLEESNGSLIESVSISTLDVPILDSGANGRAGIWVFGKFTQIHTLALGKTYYVRFSTDSSTVLWTRPIQVGISYGWDPSLGFPDGIAEYSSDSGLSWGALPNKLDLKSTHLQTYLTIQ